MILLKDLLYESSASEEAKRRGLKSIGFGRYSDPQTGKVVAKSKDGKLVAVQQTDIQQKPVASKRPQYDDETAEELDSLAQTIRDEGPPGNFKFEPFLTNNGEIKVATIEVPKESRGTGAGTKAMMKLLKWADERQLPVTLDPRPDPGKKAKLLKFYRQLGFRPANSSKYYRPESSGEWYREPQS